MLDEPDAGDLVCFVVELFALRGSPPGTLAASAVRATDLVFGGQTRRILERRGREHRLRALVRRLAERLPPELRDGDAEVSSVLAEAGARSAIVLCVGCRAVPDEARPGEAFDFSPATQADRWEAGARGMREALRRFGGTGARSLEPGWAVYEVDA